MRKFFSPWEHFLIEDALPPKAFERIRLIVSQWNKPRAGCRIREDLGSQPGASEVLWSVGKYIYPILWAEFGNNYPIITEYNCQSKGHTYDIHQDVPSKIASCVLSISDEGPGTHLYNSQKKFHHTVPWKPNNCLFFVNAPYTFHSFSSNNDFRITITSMIVKYT